MQEGPHRISLTATMPNGDAEFMKPSEKPWWFKEPTLILNSDPSFISDAKRMPQFEVDQLNNLTVPFLQQMQTTFAGMGCRTVIWQNDEAHSMAPGSVALGRRPHGVIVNPVYLGGLPEEVHAPMVRYTEQPTDANLLVLRQNFKRHLPEVLRPMIYRMAGKMFRGSGVDGSENKNFFNFIMVRDDQHLIENLPFLGKQFLNWSLMAKLGSYKLILGACADRGYGLELLHEPILSTLEGGHPFMNAQALAQQLLVIGSTRKAGEFNENDSKGLVSIPTNQWRNSAVVKGLKRLGRFLGEQPEPLLSAPVEIHDLIRNLLLVNRLSQVTKFSRQAEGAFMAFEPEILTDVGSMPWTGVPIVTCTGRFGTVKTLLNDDDLVAAIPFRRSHPADLEKVVVLPVAHQPLKGPSVEAEEFTHPALDLCLANPERYLLQLNRVENGYVWAPEGTIGNRRVPPFRGVVHLHRDIQIADGASGVFRVPMDYGRFPPVGCGVDLMHEMSKHAIQKAVDMWIARGKKDKAAIFYVPNHGYNIITFWAEDENGIIPEDPFQQLVPLMESGESKVLQFSREVPQMHNHLVLAA